jgi:hypothetical protein
MKKQSSLNRILGACPSWGKGVVGRAEMLQMHKDGAFKRFVWLSPTRQMAGEASQVKIINLPDGSGPATWMSSHKTHEINYNGVIDYIKKWFEYDRAWNVFADCALITTRAAWVLFTNKYPDLVTNTFIVMDEAQFAQVDDEQEKDGNCIGDCLNHILENQSVTHNGIGLHSGTMIRGNMFPVIHDKFINLFPRFDVPLSNYVEECKYLKSIGWTTCTYQKSPESIIRKELEIMVPFIGWIGRVNTTVCKTPELKWRNVLWFIEGVAQSNTPKYKCIRVLYEGKTYPIIRVWRGKQTYDLLNVVNENERDLMYEYLRYAHEGKVRLDGVIALELLKVGTNFGPARKAIYLGYIPHSGEAVQCLCRLVRDMAGKEHVSFINIIPHVSTTSEDTYLDRLNQHLQSTVMTAEALPYFFRTPNLPKRIVRKSRTTEGNKEDTLLQQYAPDIDQACVIKSKFIAEIIKCACNTDDYENVFRSRATAILKEYGVDGPIEEIVEEFLEDHRSNESLEPDGEGLKALHDIPEGLVDLVTKYSKLSDYMAWEMEGVLTPTLMKQIAIEVRAAYKTLEDGVCLAETLAKENGGKLYSFLELKRRGLLWLLSSMNKNPESYAHLEQDRERYSLQEGIATALKLSDGNNGKLQTRTWLRTNGYKWLDAQMAANKESYSHIPQERDRMNQKLHVELVKKLANENGGRIPSVTWLDKNNYQSIIHSIARNPELYKQWKQDKRECLTKDEVVTLAEKVAKKNGGSLPPRTTLKKMGHKQICWALDRYPEAFKHIGREYKTHTQEEALKMAKKLTRENGGKCPSRSSMTAKGYGWVAGHIATDRDAFKHLTPEYQTRTPEQWFEVATKIGYIPTQKWMKKHKMTGLDVAFRKNPHLFKNLKRKYDKYGRTI